MKILWLTTSDTFYRNGSSTKCNNYNGVGWVGAQQLELMKIPDVELGIMFITSNPNDKPKTIDGVKYFPIVDHSNSLKKLFRYYGILKKSIYERVNKQVHKSIKEFNPDILHVFGLECPLAEAIVEFKIPHIVHLQGLLIPYSVAFYPPAISNNIIRRFGSWKRELIFNNGFIHGFSQMKSGAKREHKIFNHLKNATGRTHWDKAITNLYAPKAKYFHLDEMLRPEFYIPRQKDYTKNKIIIVSTISETLYKGLDLVLRSALILSYIHNFNFEWLIIGINNGCGYQNLMERTIGIKSKDVNVTYKGILNSTEIINILSSATMYVHPSYIDNSPNSLCEAQILGLPVIACNVGGVASLINDKKDGLLIPSNEPDILAAKILELAANPDLRKSIGNDASITANKRHNKTKIIENLIKIYNEVLS